jgi:hypothetical protein
VRFDLRFPLNLLLTSKGHDKKHELWENSEPEGVAMSRKLTDLVPAIVLLAASVLTASVGAAQVSLQEQLAAQYKLAKMGSDSSGYSIIEEGTPLAIQKGGIMGLPYKSTIWPNNTFQDGTVHASTLQTANSGKASDIGKKFCGLTHKCPTAPDAASDERATKLFKVGDKVYATKIDVKTDKDTVTLSIVACDTCNKTDPPTYNKANVAFQFAKGTLATASAGQVEDTIGQLLAISNNDSQSGDQGGQQQQQGGDQGQQQAGGGGGQQQPAAEQPPAEPVNIEKGMTPDQVEAAMGKPEKKVTLGSKVIYYYKDMKVIFLSGKVSDVQ